MARLKSITIKNFRSIGEDPIIINFPERAMVS
jgi:chromosome segregation ATPase